MSVPGIIDQKKILRIIRTDRLPRPFKNSVLNRLPLCIQSLQFLHQTADFLILSAGKQPYPFGRFFHPAGCNPKSYVGGSELGRIHSDALDEHFETRAFSSGDAVKSVFHQSSVFIHQRHDIPDGCDTDHIQQTVDVVLRQFQSPL